MSSAQRMVVGATCVALLLGVLAGQRLSAVPRTHAAAAAAPVYQLRIYEIFEHNKGAFHARFRDHAVRIMAKYDFHIRSMWESRLNGRTEFVYLLEWPSEAVMKDRWAKFMADEEWARIKKETAAQHGTLVGEIQDRTLQTLDYSPLLPGATAPE
jgi:NIPSNAP protein